MEEPKYGYLRSDEDSHNYLVPENDIEAFDRLIKEIYTKTEDSDEWYEKINEFNEKYSGYRINGTRELKIVMP